MFIEYYCLGHSRAVSSAQLNLCTWPAKSKRYKRSDMWQGISLGELPFELLKDRKACESRGLRATVP
jgi:hypothetical protein